MLHTNICPFFWKKGNSESNDGMSCTCQSHRFCLSSLQTDCWEKLLWKFGVDLHHFGLTSIISTNNIQNDLHLPCHQPWASFAMSVVVVQKLCSCGRLRRWRETQFSTGKLSGGPISGGSKKTGSDGSRKDGSFIVLIFQKGAQGCHLEIQDKNSKMIFGGFFFMGANTAKRCVCVFLVFRSVASSFKDLVDQVHLVDQVPFWSWSGNLFVQLPKMMMMTLIPTTRWWHGKDFVGCCQKKIPWFHTCFMFEIWDISSFFRKLPKKLDEIFGSS